MSSKPTSYSFRDFIAAITPEVEARASDEKKATILTALQSGNWGYSLVKDAGLDSLDLVEMLMAFEESLYRTWGDVKLEGPDVDNAKDVGDLYFATCRVLNVTPDRRPVDGSQQAA